MDEIVNPFLESDMNRGNLNYNEYDYTTSSLMLANGYLGNNCENGLILGDDQVSALPQIFDDKNSLCSSVSTVLPALYSDAPAIERKKSQIFGFQQDQNVIPIPNHNLPDLHAKPPQIWFASNDLPLPPLSFETRIAFTKDQGTPQKVSPVNGSGPNGTVKPRVRARRGQATDPHSIAERLRREKIAERMRYLQELVPNTNKTDKATMLDEIIGYVKFLQLQVKVLSMSRLGAAGAVLPLLTESHTEGFSGSIRSDVTCESENISDLEQEVVNLMESNLINAMKFLQEKGLCLMPVALASAISNQNGFNSKF